MNKRQRVYTKRKKNANEFHSKYEVHLAKRNIYQFNVKTFFSLQSNLYSESRKRSILIPKGTRMQIELVIALIYD